MSSVPSSSRIGLRSAFLVLAAAACSTTAEDPESPPSAQDSVSAIADRLVSTAELRTDLRTLRVSIQPFRQDRAGDVPAHVVFDPDQEGRIRHALEREFLLALANRLYLVESGEDTPGVRAEADPDARAARLGVTHLLVGDFVRRGDDLLLSVRLVGADTRVILAATRGSVPVAAIGESSLANPGAEMASTVAATEALPPTPPPQPAEALPLPPPAQPQPEDFDTWRARRLAGGATPSLPASSRPWRTRELARLLRVPADPSVADAPATTDLERDFRWRTGELAELLRIPGASRSAETSREPLPYPDGTP